MLALKSRTETDASEEDSVIFVLYPGQTSAETSSGFYVQESGISVQ
jgi:hypothetical protein